MTVLHIGRAGPFAHEPGRRVLAVGRTRGGSALISTQARWGDIKATGTRPGAAADDRLAADLAAALREQHDAGPVAQAGHEAWHARPSREAS